MSQHLIFITCTYRRPQRIAYLRRHIDRIFSKIDNYTWIIVEDDATTDGDVSTLLGGLNAIYSSIGPTRDKGNVQRNLAFEIVRDRRLEGVIYNMDDDNLIYSLLCNELRKVVRFSIVPVGNLGPTDIERPIVRDGRILAWSAGWTERKFPVDMGGFAFPAATFFDLQSPLWSHQGVGGETEFIERFVGSTDELDVSLCHYNRMCLVYHNEPLDSPVLVS